MLGVFDGHGHDNGRAAAWAASDACQAFLRQNFERLRASPQAVMRECFEAAHEAVYAALLASPGCYEKVWNTAPWTTAPTPCPRS